MDKFKISREYRIAITVIVALAVLLFGVNFLKGKNLFDAGDIYYGVYSRVDGLTEASPVYYNGYKIGTVRKIDFYPENQKFIVSLSLEKKLPVTDETEAQITSLDMMGTKAVKFVNVQEGTPIEPGDTIRTNVQGGLQDQLTKEIGPIKDKMENLIVKLDTTLSGFSEVFSDQNNKNLAEGMNSFRGMMKNMEQSTAALDASLGEGGAIQHSLARIDSLTYAVNQQRQAIQSTMENMAAFSGQLKAMNIDTMATRLDSSVIAVNSLLKKTNEGEGSLGMMLSDKGLYYNLLDASANFDRLLADIRHNPGRYINLSAIDLGREVYLQVDDEKAKEKGIVYKVKIRESEEPLGLKNQLVENEHRIYEDTNGKKYIYSVGESSSYADICALRDKLRDEYPEASVIALQNGRPIKLRKALRKSGVKE
ncbi:MAG: MlaD family protein [Bacteroidota bacterium]